MNYWTLKILKCGLMVLVLIVFILPVTGQTINVTMQLNTATNQDTVMEHHYVDVRGECTGDNLPAITWGDDTGIILQNIGGDYWEATFQMTAGDTMRFKFWTGFDASKNTFFNWGWEGPINPADPLGGDTRSFIAGNQDTTLDLQFYNGIESVRDQYWRPYEAKPDSFVVYFRVNMGGVTETGDFDPDTDGPVGVRGGAPLDPADDWSTEISLTREDGSIDNGSFYSGVAYIANSSVSGGEQQSFKFVYRGTDVWESTANRVFSYSGAKDTTIHWAYFNDQPPTGAELVEATLTWQVKTDGLEKLGLFDRGLGEKIVIDGAKAWDIDNAIEMNYVPLLQLWMAEETFIKAPGSTFEYKAVILWDPSRVDNTSENYIPGLDLEVPLRYWDEPVVTGSGNRIYVYTDQTTQMIPGDYGFDYQYFNGIPAEGIIETPISLTFSIDMTPATDVATNPANPLFRPGIDSCEIQLYGCLMSLTQGYGLYDSAKTIELEDPDGNLIYTGTWDLKAPTTFAAGFRVNYSTETGAIIQNGGGFSKGRSYYQFIHPTSVNADGTIEWPSEFSFPMLLWMDNDLTVEDPPDLWTPTAVDPSDSGTLIRTFKLSQNYPNPFNPVTSIQYDIAHTAAVRIEIYNLMGQLVTTLVDEKQNQAHYKVQWNGKDQFGTPVPSGIYFTRMTANTFKQIRKLTLIR